MASPIIPLTYYGTGLALGTVTLSDGTRVDLRRDPSNPRCWEALAYVDLQPKLWKAAVMDGAPDLKLHGRYPVVEKESPEEALERMIEILNKTLPKHRTNKLRR